MSFDVHIIGGGLAGSEAAWQLAEAQSRAQKADAARSTLDSLLDLQVRSLGENHPRTLITRLRRIDVLLARKEHEFALAESAALLTELRQHYGEDSSVIALAHAEHASALVAMKRHAESAEAFEAASAAYAASLGAQHQNTFRMRFNAAQMLAHVGADRSRVDKQFEGAIDDSPAGGRVECADEFDDSPVPVDAPQSRSRRSARGAGVYEAEIDQCACNGILAERRVLRSPPCAVGADKSVLKIALLQDARGRKIELPERFQDLRCRHSEERPKGLPQAPVECSELTSQELDVYGPQQNEAGLAEIDEAAVRRYAQIGLVPELEGYRLRHDDLRVLNPRVSSACALRASRP